MAQNAPGRHYRKGLSLIEITRMFPDDVTAYAWFEEERWPDGPYCPHCGSVNVQCNVKHPTMTHRCRDCPKKPFFSLKTGTVMEGSKLGFQVWALAIYLISTNLKGVSSMKLHRDLAVTQKTAWHLAHRIRKALGHPQAPFSGPVEIDETYVGGKRKNMSNAKRKELAEAGAGRGTVGKAIVAGAKDRLTGMVVARKVEGTDKKTLQGFVRDTVMPGATLYTDEHGAYPGMGEFKHEAVNHSVAEYVRGMAHTNGMESFWAMLKRGYQGTFHHFSEKHLERYVAEFAGRHNERRHDTIDMMRAVLVGMEEKRLRYRELIAD